MKPQLCGTAHVPPALLGCRRMDVDRIERATGRARRMERRVVTEAQILPKEHDGGSSLVRARVTGCGARRTWSRCANGSRCVGLPAPSVSSPRAWPCLAPRLLPVPFVLGGGRNVTTRIMLAVLFELVVILVILVRLVCFVRACDGVRMIRC